eukprot:COSAG06_NODE_62551_length_264_cov_1.884848_1_plen_57_part_10
MGAGNALLTSVVPGGAVAVGIVVSWIPPEATAVARVKMEPVAIGQRHWPRSRFEAEL